MYPTNYPNVNHHNAPQHQSSLLYGRLPMNPSTANIQLHRRPTSLPHKKKLLMRSHLAMKQHRQQQQQLPRPVPCRREASDASAILSAAQALLSLSPVQQPCSTPVPLRTVSYSTPTPSSNSLSEQQPIVSTVIPMNKQKSSLRLPLLPDEMDACPSSSSSTAESTTMSDEDYHPQLYRQTPKIPRTVVTHSSASTTPVKYYSGSISLALPCDEEALSPLHCFMRRHCVEAFSATPLEVTTPRYGKSNGRRITAGQVGIRCLHCKHRQHKQERAVCFPSSLKNIYHSIETWQRRHSLVCQDIPHWIKHELAQLMQDSRSGAGGRRQYWEESAKLLGIVDTPEGLRFEQPLDQALEQAVASSASSLTMTCMMETATVDDGEHNPVVCADDRELVTGFLFVLLEQMETCQFTEQDRIGGRSKVKDCPVGFPGLQCRHCGGRAGFGRYFPTTLTALTSANSDRNIYNHIKKCRRCPAEIRDRLELLGKEQNEKNFKNRRGSRKMFFCRVWDRLHYGKNDGSSVPAVSSCNSSIM